MEPYFHRASQALQAIHRDLAKVQLPYPHIGKTVSYHTTQNRVYFSTSEFKSGNIPLCTVYLTKQRKHAQKINSLTITALEDELQEEVKEITEKALQMYEIPFRFTANTSAQK